MSLILEHTEFEGAADGLSDTQQTNRNTCESSGIETGLRDKRFWWN